MPKNKTHKTIQKRFKVTKTGKVMRGHLGARHRMFHKEKGRKRHFREPIKVGLRMAKVIKSLI